MIGDQRILAVIQARGGSKGLPRKNLADLGGLPMVAWPILIARNTAPEIDRMIVSTEDVEIAAVAVDHGAEIHKRPAHLATDPAGVHDVLLELRERLREEGEPADIVVLMEPSSPFRSPDLVGRCLTLVTTAGYDSAATFHRCRTHPHRVWRQRGDRVGPFCEGVDPWLKRQELPAALELSGQVYAFRLGQLSSQHPSLLLGRCAPVVTSEARHVDIDSQEDMELASLRFGASEFRALS